MAPAQAAANEMTPVAGGGAGPVVVAPTTNTTNNSSSTAMVGDAVPATDPLDKIA